MFAALMGSLAWAGPETGTYVGHTYVSHPRTIMMVGTVEARTDTWVLATIETGEGGVEIREKPCRVVVKPVAGVKVRMLDGAVPRLPEARFRLEGQGELSGDWTSGWAEEDLDQDGMPGVTMQVQASVCSGTLHVASTTRSRAHASWSGDELVGSLKVEVAQRILGATGACLKAAAKDSVDTMKGELRYRRVPDGTTCETATDWPVAGG